MKRPISQCLAISGLTLSLACCGTSAISAQEGTPKKKTAFAQLQTLIRPRDTQSTWRKVNWLTDVGAARRKAAKENKPILVFMAADGSPLGRT